MFRRNNKNIFFSLFILITNIIIIFSYNEEFPFYEEAQKKNLDKACKEISPIFCPMTAAIEDIFSTIQNDEIIIPKDEYYCDILCIQYSNIFARDIICENIETSPSTLKKDCLSENGEENSYEVKFNNCNVLIEGKISYRNNYTSIDFGPFLSELKFKSIIFYYSKEFKGRLNLKYVNNTQNYNYNKNNSIFSSEILDMYEQMDTIMDKIFEKYIEKIVEKSEILNEKSNTLLNTLGIFKSEFSYFEGPRLKDPKKGVTYISYRDFEYDLYIHINGKIFFSYMNVSFEYALNYNVTYNNGYFIIKNFVFQEDTYNYNIYEDHDIKDIEKRANFDDLYPDQKIGLWETIIGDFKNKFNEYRTSYGNKI